MKAGFDPRLVALLIAALAAQLSLHGLLGPFRPDVLLVVVVALAGHRRLRRPLVIALAAGLSLDLLGAGPFGVAALGYVVAVKLAAALAVIFPARQSWSAPLLLGAAELGLHLIEGWRTGGWGWSALGPTLLLGALLWRALGANGLVGEPPCDFARYRTA